MENRVGGKSLAILSLIVNAALAFLAKDLPSEQKMAFVLLNLG